MSKSVVRVLFVCMGNICRSPTAEGVFAHLVKERGLDGEIAVDSAGTGSWHVGEAPDRRAQATARQHGVEIGHQRGRAVKRRDFAQFDYICAMDGDNLRNLQKMCPRDCLDRLHLFCDFTESYRGEAVPDPYYGGADGFETVILMVRNASEGLLDEIERKHLG